MIRDEHHLRSLEDSRPRRPGSHRAFCTSVERAVEFSKLSADEQLLYEAILRVVDDKRWNLYEGESPVFVSSIARLTRDRECSACRKDGDAPNADCAEHRPFDMVSDDAVETLNELISRSRGLASLSDEDSNQQRVDFARSVIERFRKFRFEDDEERIARR